MLPSLYVPVAPIPIPEPGASSVELGDIEMEALRVELLGDVAYEAGRCQMLVPVAVGKRREERGKYVVVFARQKNGEWKAVVDSWSSDLSLNVAPELPVKPQPRRQWCPSPADKVTKHATDLC